MINNYTERHYPFVGCFNFRDIGGYLNQDGQQVKKGLYFRTGRQDRMTDGDLLKLSELKISTQIDLRNLTRFWIKEKVLWKPWELNTLI